MRFTDDLANVVCYERITNAVRQVVARQYIGLLETLAEEMAAICLQDLRVRSVGVRVEKLDIFPDATSGCRNREVFQLMTRPEPLRGGLKLPQGRYSFAQRQ